MQYGLRIVCPVGYKDSRALDYAQRELERRLGAFGNYLAQHLSVEDLHFSDIHNSLEYTVYMDAELKALGEADNV